MEPHPIIYGDDSDWTIEDNYLFFRYITRYIGNLDKPRLGFAELLNSIDFSRVSYTGRIITKCILAGSPQAIRYLNRKSLRALSETKPDGRIIRLSYRELEQSPYRKWGVII